jgi:hypothetical protein
MVVLVLIPGNKPGLAKAVDQLYGAMVADAKALRQVADRHRPFTGETLDRKQRLVLACGQAGIVRASLAELEETADQVAKLRQALIIDLAYSRASILWLACPRKAKTDLE